MSAARNHLSQNVWSKLLLLSVTLFLLPESASAQNPMMPGISLQGEPKRPLTPAEQEKQQKLDDDYKVATKKIPDRKQNDPSNGDRQEPI